MTELIRVTRGVWRPEAHLADFAGRVAAVLSGCSGDAVVSGLTAARLHGLWLPPDIGFGSTPIELIFYRDVARLEDRSRSRRPEVRGRRQSLRADEITSIDGMPVTTLARTWFELASALTSPDLVAAGDCALRRGAGADLLEATVARSRHHRGVRRAREVLPLLDGRSRSRPESHLRHALVSAGLPKPEVNVAVYSDVLEWISEPDLSYDDVRLAIEYNGADHAELRRMRRDITRENDVEMRGGWRQVTFGPAEVFGHPDQVALRVRRLRTERRLLQAVTGDFWR